MSYDSRTGAVLFAARLDRVAAFYSSVLGLSEANRDDDHILLESPGFQLVVHRIPGRPAATAEVAEGPVRRAAAAIKPVFFVRSVATVRAIANAHGGAMDPEEKEWRFHGALVCDALDRVPRLGHGAVYVRHAMRDKHIEHEQYVHEHGIDMPEVLEWTWPGQPR